MQHGFKIVDMPEVLPAPQPAFRWRRIYPFDWTIEHHPNCPIDGAPMEVIAALASLSSDERIRVGCCPRCGLVGYIDRPSEADIDHYYSETWMGETVEEARAKSLASIDRPNPRDMAVFQSLDIDRSLPVLEIGCGYGGTINALKLAGFTGIDATEHCPSRAEAVRKVFGANVTTEIPDRRYGLIVSHHVLEHCVNPAGLIRACAERQQEGDHQWHTLPRFDGEPSMGVLFFLPHLWSLNFYAMAELFRSAGYLAAQDEKDHPGSLKVAARKDSGLIAKLPYLRQQGYVERAIDKLAQGLGLAPQRCQLSWQRDSDGAAWKSLAYANQAAMNNFPRSIVVEPVASFKTDAPIEVQYPGRVEMFVK